MLKDSYTASNFVTFNKIELNLKVDSGKMNVNK